MKKAALLLSMGLAAGVCFGCGSSQDVKLGYTGEIVSHKIEVMVNDQSMGNVDILDLDERIMTVSVNGETSDVLRISDIIQQANGIKDSDLDAYLSRYQCDYQSGDDGFRPSDKGERCAMVSCSLAKLSYFGVQSHGLFYDDAAPQKNGCYHIKNLSKVLMYEVNDDAVELWIYREDKLLAKVDASQLTKVKVNGKEAVTLETLLRAADSELDLSKYLCDFRKDGSNDLISVENTSCQPSKCDAIKDQYIILENAGIDDGRDSKACYEVEYVKAVYIIAENTHYDPYPVAIKLSDGTTKTVDLATLADKAEVVNSVASVKVSDVFKAAGIDGDLASFACEAASLGNADSSKDYRPSSKGGSCSTLLSCDVLANATISLVGVHKLSANQPQNCYNVSGVNTIEMHAAQNQTPDASSYRIDVKLDGDAIASIDIVALADKAAKLDGKDVIYISDVIDAAASASGKPIILGDTFCDYADATDWRPAKAKSGECKSIRSCSYASGAYVDLADVENHKMVTTDDGPSCYSVKGIKTIEVFTADPNAAQGE